MLIQKRILIKTQLPFFNEMDQHPTSLNCEPVNYDFFAGQHILVGSVSVVNDNEYVYVTIATQDGWEIKQTQVYAGPLSGLPGGSGNPKIGNFPYKTAHNPSVTSFTYKIKLNDFSSDSCFVIATHAEVIKRGIDGNITQEETAWGSGKQISSGGSWATYSEYCKCKSEDKDQEEEENNDNPGSIQG